jgi:hypothetical protein
MLLLTTKIKFILFAALTFSIVFSTPINGIVITSAEQQQNRYYQLQSKNQNNKIDRLE